MISICIEIVNQPSGFYLDTPLYGISISSIVQIDTSRIEGRFFICFVILTRPCRLVQPKSKLFPSLVPVTNAKYRLLGDREIMNRNQRSSKKY